MSTTSRRRNGSQASCERCRKSKIRCDHEKPVCGPCGRLRRRGLESQCWYHPAPLTKRRDFQILTPSDSNQSDAVEQNSLRDTSENGSGKQSSGFHTSPSILNRASGTVSLALVHGDSNEKLYEKHLAVTEEIVSQLKFLPLIEELLHKYISFTQVALVPRPVILQLVASIRDHPATSACIKEMQGYLDNVSQIAKDVLHSSSSGVTITPSLDLEGFCALFCGTSLRVETLGLLYTVAARSYHCGVGFDEMIDEICIQGMVRCSNLSLQLARELSAPVNDLLVWLAHENLQLTTQVEGDAISQAWRRGASWAISPQTYSNKTTPFFLAECRKKTFATAYYLDKVFVSTLNRPPRIPARYADCGLPLDLSEDELFSTVPEILEQARSKLSLDGWSSDGCYQATTWARIRGTLGGFREETIEFQFRSEQSVDSSQLRSLLDRCHQAWDSLPLHLRYNQDCWTSNLPPVVCYMLGKVYLCYLHVSFEIHRLLEQRGAAARPGLLQTSARMLEIVVQIANARSRASFFHHDLPAIVMSYGLPAATILITALQDAIKDPLRSLPFTMNRPLVIRNLSVLASQLENVSNPNESNHMLCIQAAKILLRKLDGVLDSLSAPTATILPDSTLESASTPRLNSSVAIGEPTYPNSVDLSDPDGLDFETWALDFDLDAATSEWNIM
ncbi:hypothetical protein F5Y13DRAFT_182781 [Hypoxylon sp. FL1857]|nr:hypothetical protein F5Y13DRAFT_182781 [Hypoxylon sp. FL1857]